MKANKVSSEACQKTLGHLTETELVHSANWLESWCEKRMSNPVTTKKTKREAWGRGARAAFGSS